MCIKYIYLALAMHSSVASLLPATTVLFLGPITIAGATSSDSGSVSERKREREFTVTQQHDDTKSHTHAATHRFTGSHWLLCDGHTHVTVFLVLFDVTIFYCNIYV